MRQVKPVVVVAIAFVALCAAATAGTLADYLSHPEVGNRYVPPYVATPEPDATSSPMPTAPPLGFPPAPPATAAAPHRTDQPVPSSAHQPAPTPVPVDGPGPAPAGRGKHHGRPTPPPVGDG